MNFVLKFLEMEGIEKGVAEKESSGCIDLYLGEAAVDLTGDIHQLPCCIKYNGPCSVSHYFKPNHTGELSSLFLSLSITFLIWFSFSWVRDSVVFYFLFIFVTIGIEVDGLKVEEAFFRGRKLQGTTIHLPEGYSGM